MRATISQVTEGTIANEIGLKKGDVLLSINGNPVKDVIDYMFYSRDASIKLEVQRNDKKHIFKFKNKGCLPIGFEIKSFRTRTCRNKCMFCFVGQLPKGMRKTLYLKDDDYRMSFLFGNFITLTNLSSKEKKRILEQKLSPIYVSVHTTNNTLRRKMLGNPKAPDILKEIQDFTENKIRIHVQIVLCPGLNDGEELSSTIKDLQRFYPYVASIAVVPVGLTRYKKGSIRPVEKDDALKAIEAVKKFRRRLKKRHGDPLVYVADELYLKAGLGLPSLKEYGDLPQIENGVGLIPVFLHEAKKIKLPKKIEPQRNAAIVTGASFMPFLEEFAGKLNHIEGLNLEVFNVGNKFFGPSVTVTGLLTGKDILRTVVGKTKADCLLVPNVAFKSDSDVFLDNVTLKDMEETLGMCVKAIEPTPEGLLRGITDGCKRED
jgi:putative radical SAM enzyme (TIGR03279 family)